MKKYKQRTCLHLLLEQGSPNIFVRGPHKPRHKGQEPDILRNVIVSGYVTFYQIKNLFVHILFSHY